MSFYHKYRGDLLALGGFLLLTLAFFWQFLDASIVLSFKDLSRYFYPLRYLMVEQVRSGLLPLWNPYIFCGFPLLASLQVGFFYPLTAIHYYTIIHYWLAACFMYALLRHFELRRLTAFFGGMVFAFSGYLLSVSNMNTSLSSVIWLPLALLFLDKYINSSFVIRHSAFFWLVITLALMFLGGEPTIIYVSAWFLAGYVLVFSPNRWRDLLALALAFVWMLGLIAIQLLPFAELIRLSDRLELTGYDFISSRSLPPREIINFIFPYFFGNAGILGGYTEVLIGKSNQDWLISIYFGIVPLIALFFAWGKKRAGYFGGAALVALLLACGRYTWFYRLLFYVVPGISLVRYPVKYLFVVTFFAAILAAFMLSAVGYLFVNQIDAYLLARYSVTIPKVFFDLLRNMVKFNLQSAYSLVGYLGGAALVCWLAWRNKISAVTGLALLLLITAADLLANGSSIAIGVPAEVFSRTPDNYRLLLNDRSPGRFFYTYQVENNNRVIYGPTYAAALANTRDNLAANWYLPYHLYDLFGYESVRPYKLISLGNGRFSGDNYADNLAELSAYNVRYVLTAKPLRRPGMTLLRHKYAYGQDLYIYRNERALSRAYLVSGEGAVTIDSYRPGRITMIATAETAATLFLSEASYPGWKFLVDGKFAGVPKPEAVFSSVSLEPGRHRVEFVYDPLSLKVGALISGLTILLAGGLMLLRRR
jgi:hypothetical protein